MTIYERTGGFMRKMHGKEDRGIKYRERGSSPGGENVGRLVIDGNAVYEIDEECERRKKENRPQKGENTERTNRKGGR